ncbi:uncharacterized protein LOC133359610 isoform X1 [Lethenteron reissneri]|uniref:uncharacterized protein LOC133359610 isoform X1 n=2 Tax=Lethenteron reissneri TaxID=7753 RepID=UPI002AB64C6C|nr:uncharacterized protein LOC133359610 isoform X1 [Lethenteron reissneri]
MRSESPTQATGPQDSMASPLPNQLLAYLLLTLFVLTIRLAHAETFKKTGGPNDVEVERKCGFSLKTIHDCKYQKCQEASTICAAMTPGDQPVDSTDCQIERCMKEKKKCEEKLNKYLSEEEKCEGDAFNDVDMNCLLKFRTSLDQLTECKRDGYLLNRTVCFKEEWSRRITAYATSKLKAFKISSEAQKCAYNKCFDNVKTCLHEHHTELAVNPASKRRFEMDHCAYVAVDFPHECENIISIAGCADSIATCIENHPDYTYLVIIGGVVGAVAVVAVVVAVSFKFREEISAFIDQLRDRLPACIHQSRDHHAVDSQPVDLVI